MQMLSHHSLGVESPQFGCHANPHSFHLDLGLSISTYKLETMVAHNHSLGVVIQ